MSPAQWEADSPEGLRDGDVILWQKLHKLVAEVSGPAQKVSQGGLTVSERSGVEFLLRRSSSDDSSVFQFTIRRQGNTWTNKQQQQQQWSRQAPSSDWTLVFWSSGSSGMDPLTCRGRVHGRGRGRVRGQIRGGLCGLVGGFCGGWRSARKTARWS